MYFKMLAVPQSYKKDIKLAFHVTLNRIKVNSDSKNYI